MPTAPAAPPALPVLPSTPARGAEPPCLAMGCSACCHDIEMLLTEDDVRRIRAHLGPAGNPLDFHFEAEDGYLQLRTRNGPAAKGWQGGSGLVQLGGGPPRPCIFLSEDGRCSIHDVRPEGCRLYPLVWDDGLRAAELDDLYCPHTQGFLATAAAGDAVQRLAQRLHAERDARMVGRPRRRPHG